MRLIGSSIFDELSNVEGVESVLSDCEIYYVQDKDNNIIKVFDSTNVISGKHNSTTFVNNYLNDNDPEVSVVVSNDTRGEGLSFFRRNENPNVDFSKVAGHPGVIYASEEGQLAKTESEIPMKKRMILIEAALNS